MAADRAVIKHHFTTSYIHHWWPLRKNSELDSDRGTDVKGRELQDHYLAQNNKLYRLRSRIRHVPKRMHILGAGNLGCFVAHALAGLPSRPPITLLLRLRRLRRWEERGCSIDVTTNGLTETRRGFEGELIRQLQETPPEVEGNNTEIDRSLPHDMVSGGNALRLVSPPETVQPPKNKEGQQANTPPVEVCNSVVKDLRSQEPQPISAIKREENREAAASAQQDKEVNAWFAQAEHEVEQAQYEQGSKPGSEKTKHFDENEEIIYHLIVSVKAPHTVKAIRSVAHRLTQDSSILFLQNGMGIIDQINKELFTDEKYRPTYIIGVVSHGLYSDRPFSVIHAGEGTIALGVMPRMPMNESLRPETLDQLATSARYIIRTMTRSPVLVAVGFPPTDLLQQQLDKLAVNCIINPLTAILDCNNGALLSNFHFTRVMRLLLAEISLVIKSLPELQNVPNVNTRFDTLRLERLVVSIANTTASNKSSMLQDVRAGRQTEIDFINGYIVRRGEEMGVHCVMNYMLLHMVKGKDKKSSLEQADLLPLAGVGKG
ncbi:hypothetical protein MMC28_010770 [Mycoblastus sanguinarius]|nr:hypothetical protein [Mycoblastus sanguinarius]